MFDITLADAQIALATIFLVVIVLRRIYRGLYTLLSEPNASSQRLFYEPHAAFKRRT